MEILDDKFGKDMNLIYLGKHFSSKEAFSIEVSAQVINVTLLAFN